MKTKIDQRKSYVSRRIDSILSLKIDVDEFLDKLDA